MKFTATLAVAAIGLQFALAAPARAEFPEKTIRLVVPFAPGGGVDALARPFAKELGEILKQNVIVDNKASSTGQTGAIEVARAPADGYTLLITSAAFATTPAFYPKVPYDPVKDFDPITIVASTPQVIVANPKFKANNVQELVALARSGAQVNFALAAATGIQALGAELIGSMAKVNFTKVPYKGAGAAFSDLIGGQVDVMVDNPASSMPHVRAGKLKLLATTGLKRMPTLPNVPTVAEVLPGYQALNWFILAAPVGTPAPVLDKLHAATAEALKRASMRQFFERDGLDTVANSRTDAKKFVSDEMAKWGAVVREKGLQMQ